GFKRGGPKAAARSGRLLQHEMRVVQGEVGEPFLPPLKPDLEADQLDVEGKRAREIPHVEFRDETGIGHVVVPCAAQGRRRRRPPRSWAGISRTITPPRSLAPVRSCRRGRNDQDSSPWPTPWRSP